MSKIVVDTPTTHRLSGKTAVTLFLLLLFTVGLYTLLKYTPYNYRRLVKTGSTFLTKTRYANKTEVRKSNLSTYAVCKSNLSTSLVCDKLEEGRIYVDASRNLVTWGIYVSDNWGNTLSPYWQARGAAFLLGSSFTCGQWFTQSWISLLPASVPPSSSGSCINSYPELFHRMCDDSGSDCNMVYAHKCAGAWNHIRDQIQQNTRSAMERWATANNEKIPVFNTSEIVIYDRCSDGTVLDHDEHGPLAHSALQYIPKTVTIVYQVYAKARTTPICDAIRQSQITYLKHVRPDLVVISLPGSLWEDYAKLVYAPYVLVISAGSSFALWATLANVGYVWTPPLYGGMTPDVGNNFHWINTPILYPNIGQKFNFTGPGNRKDVDKILEWLKNR